MLLITKCQPFSIYIYLSFIKLTRSDGISSIIFNLGGVQITPYDITTRIQVFIQNLIFGLTTAYLIIKWGNLK